MQLVSILKDIAVAQHSTAQHSTKIVDKTVSALAAPASAQELPGRLLVADAYRHYVPSCMSATKHRHACSCSTDLLD
jgi:hypothetical protein